MPAECQTSPAIPHIPSVLGYFAMFVLLIVRYRQPELLAFGLMPHIVWLSIGLNVAGGMLLHYTMHHRLGMLVAWSGALPFLAPLIWSDYILHL